MSDINDTTSHIKANTEAIRENLAALKEMGSSRVKGELDKNRQELRTFKSDVDSMFQNVFKGIDRDFRRTLDFGNVLQKGLNDVSRQIQKSIQQSITQAIQQSMQGGAGGFGSLLGNLLQAPLSGLFKSSQGQMFADATKALMRGRRNM